MVFIFTAIIKQVKGDLYSAKVLGGGMSLDIRADTLGEAIDAITGSLEDYLNGGDFVPTGPMRIIPKVKSLTLDIGVQVYKDDEIGAFLEHEEDKTSELLKTLARDD